MSEVFEVLGESEEDVRRRVQLLRMTLRAQGSSVVAIRPASDGRSVHVVARRLFA